MFFNLYQLDSKIFRQNIFSYYVNIIDLIKWIGFVLSQNQSENEKFKPNINIFFRDHFIEYFLLSIFYAICKTTIVFWNPTKLNK